MDTSLFSDDDDGETDFGAGTPLTLAGALALGPSFSFDDPPEADSQGDGGRSWESPAPPPLGPSFSFDDTPENGWPGGSPRSWSYPTPPSPGASSDAADAGSDTNIGGDNSVPPAAGASSTENTHPWLYPSPDEYPGMTLGGSWVFPPPAPAGIPGLPEISGADANPPSDNAPPEIGQPFGLSVENTPRIKVDPTESSTNDGKNTNYSLNNSERIKLGIEPITTSTPEMRRDYPPGPFAAVTHLGRWNYPTRLNGGMGGPNLTKSTPGHPFKTTDVKVQFEGSPFAYNETNTGEDELGNAKSKGKWVGVAKNDKGIPYKNELGNYVASTSWSDPHGSGGKRQSDFVNGDVVPMVSLSDEQNKDMKLGDFVCLENRATGLKTWAIYGDNRGDRGGIEISFAAAINLGIGFKTKRGTKMVPDTKNEIWMTVYPGSRNGKFPHGQSENK